MRDRLMPALLVTLLALCSSPGLPRDAATRLNAVQFRELMQKVERGWSIQDTELALSAFSVDAVYMEPPDVQLFRGHAELRPYFEALTPGTFMRFHRVFFDEVEPWSTFMDGAVEAGSR